MIPKQTIQRIKERADDDIVEMVKELDDDFFNS